MSRRTKQPALPDVPFWRTGSFRFACVGSVLCGLAALTWWMQEENVKRQMERKLRENAVLSRLAVEWKARIRPAPPVVAGAAAATPSEAAPRALWFGKVSSYKSAPDMSLLTLSDAILVAGERSRNDADTLVRIAPPRGYRFSSPPAAGEMWLVAVTRNEDGSNVIRYAEKAR